MNEVFRDQTNQTRGTQLWIAESGKYPLAAVCVSVPAGLVWEVCVLPEKGMQRETPPYFTTTKNPWNLDPQKIWYWHPREQWEPNIQRHNECRVIFLLYTHPYETICDLTCGGRKSRRQYLGRKHQYQGVFPVTCVISTQFTKSWLGKP